MFVRPSLVLLLASCASPRATPEIVASIPPKPVPAITVDPTPPPRAPAQPRIEMTFVGDLMFGGYFKDRYKPYRAERHDPLAAVGPLLASDLALGNLETTIARELPTDGTGDFRFVTLPQRVAVLRDRLHAVTLANNHMFDNDIPGLAETTQILDELGVRFVGAARARPAAQFRVDELRVGGWRVGFIAASTRLNRRPAPADPQLPYTTPEQLRGELVPVITAARRTHDLVIVLVHWGNEYEDAPMPWQIEAAHAFVDAGAHLVIGHHPHVLQAIERYRDAVIAYSLGNFVFPNARKHAPAGVLRVGLANADAPCFDTIAFHPTVQRGLPIVHPAPATATERVAIAKHLFELSAALATTWAIDRARFTTAATCVSGPASSSASPAASSR